MANLTLDQWEDRLGLPIVLLQLYDPTLKQWFQLRVRDLPLTGIAYILQFINQHSQ